MISSLYGMVTQNPSYSEMSFSAYAPNSSPATDSSSKVQELPSPCMIYVCIFALSDLETSFPMTASLYIAYSPFASIS